VIEVEDKFRVHPDFAVPDLVDGSGRVAVVSTPRNLTLTAVYLDTCDLRLAREGITLRHRSGGDDDGWHLKLPVPGSRVGVREELLVEGHAELVPDRLARLVTAYVREQRLQPRATLRTLRTKRDLLGSDGTLLAELVDDRVDALTHDHHAARFREIEVEDKGGGSDVLDHVGGLLRAAGAVGGEFQPKVVRALGHEATAPPELPPPVRAGLADPARVLIAAALRRHVRLVLEHDVGVRLDTPDALHQMRVNARRTRSILRAFADLLDPTWCRDLLDEIRWMSRTLSAGRENEVVLERLRSAFDDLVGDDDTQRAQQRLEAMLDDDAAAARAPVEEMLASDRYVSLLSALVDAAAHPRTLDAADRPCREVLPGVVERSWRRFSRRAAKAGKRGASAEQLHRARIAAKNMRYLASAVADVYGKPARRLAADAEAVQEVLGEHQDAVVACAVLRRAARAPRAGGTAFVYGALYAVQQQAADQAQAEFRTLWPTVQAPRLGRWRG
jgi:CHAD domain-containing protein